MSLLTKWTKKKEKEQLQATDKASDVVVAEKKEKTNKETKKIAEKKDVKVSQVDARAHNHAYRILIRPCVSEKATEAETHSVYTFIVSEDASKTDIISAVEAIYGKRPSRVRTARFEGKRMRFGYRRGKRKDWKKAYVYMPQGVTLHIHEGV